jgi:hypothetical protein
MTRYQYISIEIKKEREMLLRWLLDGDCDIKEYSHLLISAVGRYSTMYDMPIYLTWL